MVEGDGFSQGWLNECLFFSWTMVGSNTTLHLFQREWSHSWFIIQKLLLLKKNLSFEINFVPFPAFFSKWHICQFCTNFHTGAPASWPSQQSREKQKNHIAVNGRVHTVSKVKEFALEPTCKSALASFKSCSIYILWTQNTRLRKKIEWGSHDSSGVENADTPLQKDAHLATEPKTLTLLLSKENCWGVFQNGKLW